MSTFLGENFGQRTTYERAFKTYVDIASKKLGSESFASVDKFFAVARRHIEITVNSADPGTTEFGASRNPKHFKNQLKGRKTYTTAFRSDGAYQGAVKRLELLFAGKGEQYGLKFQGELFGNKSYQIDATNPLNPNGDLIVLTQYNGRINENGVLRNLSLDGSNQIDSSLPSKVGYIEAIHTSAEQLDTIYLILDSLYKAALKPADPNILFERIGRFHWWYANAMPYKRGSAAIGKMHIAAMLSYHKQTLKGISIDKLHSFPSIHGIDIDVLAMTIGDPDVFARYYGQALKANMPLENSVFAKP